MLENFGSSVLDPVFHSASCVRVSTQPTITSGFSKTRRASSKECLSGFVILTTMR